MRVLIVCTGNTCRSPMAEALLKSQILPQDDIEVISGGIFAYEGESASKNAVLALKEKGIDISAHTAKNINESVVRDADLILTMTKAHKQTLIDIYADVAEKKTYTLCEYAQENGDIADPYGGDVDVYRACASRLLSVIKKVYERIRSGEL